MRYTIPTIVNLGSASTEIQSVPLGDKGSAVPDSDPNQPHTLSTGGCYDLDE